MEDTSHTDDSDLLTKFQLLQVLKVSDTSHIKYALLIIRRHTGRILCEYLVFYCFNRLNIKNGDIETD